MMKVLGGFLVAMMVVVVIYGQEDTTTEVPPTGVEYGGFCNGFLLQCNRHNSTVACMYKHQNETIGAEQCETGLGVDLGRCQCTRNCGSDAIYHENGEFDDLKSLCVGFVGQLCTSLVPHCTAHATCNLLTSKCVCQVGYTPTPDGKRCAATTSSPQFLHH